MKLAVLILFVALIMLFTGACAAIDDNPDLTTATHETELTLGSESSALTSVSISTETTVPVLPEPDHAGNSLVLFDIFIDEGSADLDGDGTSENIILAIGPANSVIYINNMEYLINHPGLYKSFAIIDIDLSDEWKELIFTETPNDGNEEYELESYIYWWNGKELYFSGTIHSLDYMGLSRDEFDPGKYFDGEGSVFSPIKTRELIPLWYPGTYRLDGDERILTAQLEIAEPYVRELRLKINPGFMCALLFEKDEMYFDPDYNVAWDYASWPHINGRVTDPEPKGTFSIIATGPEELTVTGIYGGKWFRLKTDDGYEGWICVEDSRVKGYDNVMFIDMFDIFENAVDPGD